MVVLHACQYTIEIVSEKNLTYQIRINGKKVVLRSSLVLEIPKLYLRPERPEEHIYVCLVFKQMFLVLAL